jgi:serine-type D-Ala-D-Ala carboxypeptidase/endopeptidase (penicillin-binding protein 4)
VLHTRGLAVILAVSAVGACVGPGPAAASPASLRRALEAFAGGGESSGLSYGVVFLPVTEADTAGSGIPDRAVRAHANAPLVPASLAKLPTTAFALEELGADFTFSTKVFAAGPMVGDTLTGDLVIAGGGDPFLVSERLWLLAREIRATGVRAVSGRLIVDGSWMAADSTDPLRSREREVSDRPYAARLSALATNFDAAAIRITPGNRAGEPVVTEADPLPCGYLRLDNRLATGAADSPERLVITLGPDGNGGEIARLEGTLPARAGARVEYRSVSAPLAFSASLVRAFLAQEGIAIAGPTAFAPTPSDARLLVDFPSLPLGDLVGKANRYSNNFMADQLALALSTRKDSTASLTRAGRWITARLRATCGAPATVRQLDGSGLHPGSRLSAETLARLLARAWNDFRVGPDFAASLAVPGQEGTLRNRFKDGPLPAMRGKTGTMSEPLASGIAGYLEAGRGRVIAFAILMNAPANAGWDLGRMKARQEAWVREFLR